MKKVYYDRIFSAVAVAIWMTVIFLFSAQNGDTSGAASGSIVEMIVRFLYSDFDNFSPDERFHILETWQLIVRKTAHFSEYAILGMLSANAIRTYKFSAAFSWALPSVICLVYAISDEIHQYFVPDRACRFLDICIDTAGGIFGVTLFMIAMFIISKRVKRRKI